MGERATTVSGMAAAVVLVTSLSGCAYRWVLSEPTEVASNAPTEPTHQDAELDGLESVRRQLEQRLARVEEQLAALPSSEQASSEQASSEKASSKKPGEGRREELLTERLSIAVALVELDRAIETRRDELADPGLPTPSYAPAEVPPPDPASLVRRAEERVAAHRRSARFGEGGEAVAGQGLLGVLGGVGGAKMGAGRATRGRKGGRNFDFDDDSNAARAATTGKGDELDALLNALPKKRKQASASRSFTGEREKKEAPRPIYRPKKGDERYQDRIKAAVVNAGGPPADVMPAVRRHRAQLLACLPSELRDGGLRITVRARIAASGSFRAPQVTAVPALSPDVAACVADVIQRIQLPPQDDSRSVQFSLRFQGS